MGPDKFYYFERNGQPLNFSLTAYEHNYIKYLKMSI